MGLYIVDVFGGWAGDPWNVGERARWSPGQRGTAALQQELPVVDDSCTSRCCAEQSAPGSSGVVVGHVRGVVYGHPPGRNGLASSGLLTARRHLQNTGAFANNYKLNNLAKYLGLEKRQSKQRALLLLPQLFALGR